ncbi:MAG: trigger factor [Bacteroidota bacterium]
MPFFGAKPLPLLPNLKKANELVNAGVVKLVDTPDLGSGAARLGGSSPSTRTGFFHNIDDMATITREQIAPLHERIKVKVEQSDYTSGYEASLKKYAKSANIPGFRKGMVPAGVIKKMYGASVFTEEVLRSIENELMKYLQTENISYLGQPLPEDSNDPAQFDHTQPSAYTFSFEIGMKPEFSIPDLAKAKTTINKVEVTEEMVNEEIDRFQRRLGKMTEPETVSNEEDVLNVSFQKCSPDGTVEEGAEKKDNSLLLKYFSAAAQKELMGKKKDDAIIIQLGKAFEDKEREWLASDLGMNKESKDDMNQSFLMSITRIAFVEKRNLDAEFFKEALPAKEVATEEEFRNELRQQIDAYWGHQAQHLLEHEIFHILSEDTKMNFPEAFLKKWLLKSGEKEQTEEAIEKEFPAFLNQLRWTLVSNEIGVQQSIQVSREEIVDSMRQQLMGYFGSMNLGGNYDWLDSYIDRMMADKKQVESAYQRVFSSKVLTWAASQAKPTEKKVTAKEFAELQGKHQH